ncbi:Mom family adenine methylcarbamoylation protein [Microvirga lotononidis]
MRWNSRRASYRPSQEPIDPSQFSVAPVGDAIARDFVIRHHYSGSYPAAVAAYGMFQRIAAFQEELVGVAVFSVPMQPKAAAAYGAPADAKFCELGRFVLKDHVAGNGKRGSSGAPLGCWQKTNSGLTEGRTTICACPTAIRFLGRMPREI